MIILVITQNLKPQIFLSCMKETVFIFFFNETATTVIYTLSLHDALPIFRMQGVEFDNGDMYVDGHKAASDVRDEPLFRSSIMVICMLTAIRLLLTFVMSLYLLLRS